jgi:hypothetical protein
VLGSIFLRSWFTNNLRQPPDRLQQLVVGQNLIPVCHENAHQAECVETMYFRTPGQSNFSSEESPSYGLGVRGGFVTGLILRVSRLQTTEHGEGHSDESKT